MIVITKVEIFETPERTCRLKKFDGISRPSKPEDTIESYNYKEEFVKGRRFVCDHLGIDTYIAWTEEVGKILGVPFSVFESQQDIIYTLTSNCESMRKEIRKLNDTITKHENYGFF